MNKSQTLPDSRGGNINSTLTGKTVDEFEVVLKTPPETLSSLVHTYPQQVTTPFGHFYSCSFSPVSTNESATYENVITDAFLFMLPLVSWKLTYPS